eukprot:6492317-Amphidinium_carterae.1
MVLRWSLTWVAQCTIEHPSEVVIPVSQIADAQTVMAPSHIWTRCVCNRAHPAHMQHTRSTHHEVAQTAAATAHTISRTRSKRLCSALRIDPLQVRHVVHERSLRHNCKNLFTQRPRWNLWSSHPLATRGVICWVVLCPNPDWENTDTVKQ